MRKVFLPVIIVSAFIFSCQQEIDQVQQQVDKCKISTAWYYGGGGGAYDSAQFIYDAQGKIIKWIGTEGNYDYFYAGNNITARVFHENVGGELWYIDSIRYNPDNTIRELAFYDFSGLFGYDSVHNKIIFHYQGDKVTNLETVEFFNQGNGPETDTTFTTITWNASATLKKCVF